MGATHDKVHGLSGTALKLLGCLFMTIDHIGVYLFPATRWLRLIGRIAMPIFAYLIAEGCRYTRHKCKHFLLVFLSGIVFYVGAGLIAGIWYFNIFQTFALSILYIYLWQWIVGRVISDSSVHRVAACLYALLFVAALVGGYVLCLYVPLEYGFYAVLLPVILAMTHAPKGCTDGRFLRVDTPVVRLILCACMLLILSVNAYGTWQYYCLLSLPLLALYNGRPGRRRLKYFFYLYYPAHVGILCAIKLLFF